MDKLAGHEIYPGSEVPVKNAQAIPVQNGSVALNPKRDLVKVQRIAIKMNVVKA